MLRKRLKYVFLPRLKIFYSQTQHRKMSQNEAYEKELAFQADRRKATVEFIKIVSDLWYDKSIELVLFFPGHR